MIHDNGVIDLVLVLAVLIPSIILHEVAHGAVADRLGDTTARDAGRLTLNPIRHIDPFGSLLLPSMLALAGQNVFGWAKPVPVQPARFRNPTSGMALVGFAGPLTNVAIAAIAGTIGPFVDVRSGASLQDVELVSRLGIGITTDALWGRMLFGLLIINLALAVFNMLPIPPLDGSRLIPLILPPKGRLLFSRASQYGMLVIILLVFVFEDSLAWISDVIGWMARLLV